MQNIVTAVKGVRAWRKLYTVHGLSRKGATILPQDLQDIVNYYNLLNSDHQMRLQLRGWKSSTKEV